MEMLQSNEMCEVAKYWYNRVQNFQDNVTQDCESFRIANSNLQFENTW